MSVSVEADVSSPLSEGQSTLDPTISKSSSDSQSLKNEDIGAGQDDKSVPTTPKLHPMAFTVDFGEAKPVNNSRLEELAKKSQARHQRVQSMSASLTRTSPASQRPPMSAKLPRKAQGYNSEGYFSSDQEDSGLSNSIKHRGQNITSPITNRHIKSPVTDNFQPKRMSKSPIVDSIMSRSDNFTLNPRLGLNLPLKNSSYVKDVNYHPKTVADIIDQSPEVLLTDISSPELDILTPDNGLSTPEQKSPVRKSRGTAETPDLFKKCIVNEALYIDDDDDDVDRQSNSSTGTYTIEGDNYTEEQKARMSIDRNFAAQSAAAALKIHESEPELMFDYSKCVITKEPRRDTALRSPLSTNQAFDIPKVSKDKNVLEISCCYESPTENDLAAQTSKQIKSTRSYLEKIKNRVRTITEKTFAKSPPKLEDEPDVGSFTSVTTSGVLSSKIPDKVYIPIRRRCSLTKSDIDQTDYVHRITRESSVPVDYTQRISRESSTPDYLQRLSRESSVPVSLPSTKSAFDEGKFESTALRNAQKAMRDDSGVSSDITPDQMVGKLSYLSINRCKGDKTWIQDWADSVKKYNNNVLAKDDVDERPPLSPRNLPARTLSPHGAPSKIPSPVGTLLSRRTPDLIPTQDTESYLLKTQNAITNLQAKLQSSRTANFSSIPSQLTSSLISEKTAVSRLPVSQLSRSNSLNYRLRKKEHSNDSSPLRSPGHYVITGSAKVPETTKILLNSASRSLDAERRSRDSNMNSPSSERGLHSNSSDDKTLSNRPPYDVNAILSPHRKTHTRHKSFEGRNPADFNSDVHNANATVCLKTVLKNNALEAQYHPRIDQTRCQGDKKHQRVLSDSIKPLKSYSNVAFGTSIKRSSSFNTVNKNNNYIDTRLTRRFSGHSEEYKDSEESDNESYDKSQDCRYKRQVHQRRIDSPNLKSIAPANSPRCPGTPEMQRKFGPGLVRNSVRVTNKERVNVNTRMSEPPVSRDERKGHHQSGHQSRRISEPTRQAVLNRLTKSRSSTREPQPLRTLDKGPKKPSQHRSSSALATKEVELANWKKRSSYDPMKAAQEGKRRQVAKRQECKDDLSSPSSGHTNASSPTANLGWPSAPHCRGLRSASQTRGIQGLQHHSSPVHRSQSFHTSNMAELVDYSSEETEDEQLTLPADPMITSTCSDILDLRRRGLNFNFQQPTSEKRRHELEKRKTYLIDDITPTKENIAFLPKQDAMDKRRTFILDSDTASTTNGSSPRNSSIFSHEKSITTGASDSEGESCTDSAPVVMRKKGKPAQPKQRYSGEYSVSSSSTSAPAGVGGGGGGGRRDVAPRYLDISKYKSEASPKNFLRRDPSKTYVAVLPPQTHKQSKQHIEIEQKKQELEKWKRRASYDPRKAAALGKTVKTPPKTASSVLRSQSFHGPVLTSSTFRYQPPDNQITESYDASSDNDF